MRLRKYLVKRIIHMVITLIIVLVLLFVLFRLMPGSAAQSLFMKPGITEIEKNQIAVRYGFSKWVDLPGNNFINTYQIEQIGEYTFVINATDGSVTESMELQFSVNVNPAITDLVPPDILDISYSYSATGANYINLTAIVADDWGSIRGVQADIQKDLIPMEDPLLFFESLPNIYTVTMEDVEAGNYTLTYSVIDGNNNVATAKHTFIVDVDGFGNVTSVTQYIKLWNVGTDSAAGIHLTGDSVDIHANSNITGSTPTYTITQPDNTTFPPDGPGVLTQSTGDLFTVPFVPTMNGEHGLEVTVGTDVVYSSFPINSPDTAIMASPTDSDGLSPVFSDLTAISYYENAEIDEYPFILREGGSVNFSVDVVNADGERWERSIAGEITSPNGETGTIVLEHPVGVEDRGMLEQFYVYMKNMLVFDFGDSFEDNRPVWDVMIERIPATLLLFGSALLFSYTVGILIGVIVAWRRGSVLELSTIVVTLFFYSMPIFWSALIAQWIFYSQLGWFPLSGFGGADNLGNKLEGFSYVFDVLWHLALPLVTLTVLSLAGTILLMRSSMLEVMGEDFITTAKAKGLKQRTVVYKHAARNAMLPVVTSMALALGGVISGGVLTETIFSWPGMGTLLVQGTLKHNYPVVQGAFYILALMTIVGNMIADILYAYLDPRVQL